MELNGNTMQALTSGGIAMGLAGDAGLPVIWSMVQSPSPEVHNHIAVVDLQKIHRRIFINPIAVVDSGRPAKQRSRRRADKVTVLHHVIEPLIWPQARAQRIQIGGAAFRLNVGFARRAAGDGRAGKAMGKLHSAKDPRHPVRGARQRVHAGGGHRRQPLDSVGSQVEAIPRRGHPGLKNQFRIAPADGWIGEMLEHLHHRGALFVVGRNGYAAVRFEAGRWFGVGWIGEIGEAVGGGDETQRHALKNPAV